MWRNPWGKTSFPSLEIYPVQCSLYVVQTWVLLELTYCVPCLFILLFVSLCTCPKNGWKNPAQRKNWMHQWITWSMYPATEHAHAQDRWPQALKALFVVNSFKLHLNAYNVHYYVVESASRQEEPNPVFWLDTRVAKVGLSCLCRFSCIGPTRSSLFGQIQSRWLDICLVFFSFSLLRFYWSWLLLGPRICRQEPGQYIAILISRLDNNAYIRLGKLGQ